MKKLNQSSRAQRARLLALLRERPVSTIEARHKLDILGVAARIFELRHHYGYNIVTHEVVENNPYGGRHRIAQYVLMSGQYKDGEKSYAN